jgi:hypothetical protein
MDSVNLASEANSNEATNRIKALAGVAERIGCTLTQVRISTLWLNGRQLTCKVKEYAGEAGLTPGLSRVTKMIGNIFTNMFTPKAALKMKFY